MAERATTGFTPEQFLDWAQYQDHRYELVGGQPTMMADAKAEHDLIVLNTLAELRRQLRGKPCRPFTADFAVRIPTGQIRRPDAGVDCGPIERGQLVAERPRLVFEVLSPSTRSYDQVRKLDEYRSVGSIGFVVLLDPDAPRATLWSRQPDGGWQRTDLDGIDAAIMIPELQIELALAEVYADVPLPQRPRLVTEP